MIARVPAITQKLANDDLSVQQTLALSTVIEKQTIPSTVVEEVMAWQMPTVPLSLEAEDNDVSILQTVPMHAVERKQVAKKIGTFFVTIALLLVSTLFLGILAAIILILPNPAYKAEILMLSLIVLSYIASAQMKRMDRVRQQVYLNMTQFVQKAKQRSSSIQLEDEERKHFKLIKQDTTAYLRALKIRDLKKGPYR